ncbi:hypothetical protein [Pelomonas aquatica]|jgi:hypothetical protein|nr:hypothetical protein [Pelomonas aquatica]
MPPKMHRLLLVTTLLGVSLPASANPTKQELAMRLVAVMRLDYTVLDALQWQARVAPAFSGDVSACLGGADYKRFTAPIANVVARDVSVDDIAYLLGFYSSPAGSKFTEAALVDAHKHADPGIKEDYPDISPDEYAQISSLIKSEPYARFRGVQTYASVRQTADQLLAECRAGK